MKWMCGCVYVALDTFYRFWVKIYGLMDRMSIHIKLPTFEPTLCRKKLIWFHMKWVRNKSWCIFLKEWTRLHFSSYRNACLQFFRSLRFWLFLHHQTFIFSNDKLDIENAAWGGWVQNKIKSGMEKLDL